MDEPQAPGTEREVVVTLAGFYPAELVAEATVVDLAARHTLCEDCRRPVVVADAQPKEQRALCRTCYRVKLETYMAALSRGFRIG